MKFASVYHSASCCVVAFVVLFATGALSPLTIAYAATACEELSKPRVVCNLGSTCEVEAHFAKELCVEKLTIMAPSAPTPGGSITGASDLLISSTFLIVAITDADGKAPPVQNIPQQVSLDAALPILQAIANNPLDLATQEKAREIIKKCEASKTLSDMQSCSGFIVPPQVLKNCLNGGACIPLPPPQLNPNLIKRVAWAPWQAYNDNIERKTEAFVRPWVTSNKMAESCRREATVKGQFSESQFGSCMAQVMGGSQSTKAIKCFKQYADDPSGFGACLSEITLKIEQRHVAQCVARLSVIPNLPPASFSACLGDSSAESSKEALACAQESKGEPYLFGSCLAGFKMAQSDKNLIKVKQCIDKTKGPDLEAKTLVECVKLTTSGSDLKKIEDTIAFGKCIQSNSEDIKKQLACAPKLAPEAQIPICAIQATDAIEAAKCAGISGADQLELAKKCIEAANGDKLQIALCIGGTKSLNADQMHAVGCAKSSQSGGEFAACAASKYVPKDVALTLNCAQSGSPAGFAVCMAGPKMNAELRIASECLASTGGEPMSFVGCAGGRLAMKELQQCISGNFKAENGCFGENNEIVKAFAAQEKVLRGVLKAVGLETAYNNVLNDLKSGKLGENNEVVKVFKVINAVTLQQPAKAAENIVREFGAAGQQIAGGIEHLAQEITKALPGIKIELPKIDLPKVTSLPKLPNLPKPPNWESPNISIGGFKPKLW